MCLHRIVFIFVFITDEDVEQNINVCSVKCLHIIHVHVNEGYI